MALDWWNELRTEIGRNEAAVVLMVTSGEQPGDLARSRELGIAAYLTKPVRRAELRAAISAGYLGGKLS